MNSYSVQHTCAISLSYPDVALRLKLMHQRGARTVGGLAINTAAARNAKHKSRAGALVAGVNHCGIPRNAV